MIITVSPLGRGRFRACLDGRVVCASISVPLYAAARVLLREGVDPSTPIATQHEGSTIIAMRSTVGAAARLTVTEGDREGLRLVLYREPPKKWGRDGGGSPSRTAKVDTEGMEVA